MTSRCKTPLYSGNSGLHTPCLCSGLYWGYIGVILGLYWGYIGVIWGIMEKKMETTILGFLKCAYELRVRLAWYLTPSVWGSPSEYGPQTVKITRTTFNFDDREHATGYQSRVSQLSLQRTIIRRNNDKYTCVTTLEKLDKLFFVKTERYGGCDQP